MCFEQSQQHVFAISNSEVCVLIQETLAPGGTCEYRSQEGFVVFVGGRDLEELVHEDHPDLGKE